jgi:replicative DNA helicase
MKCVDLFSDTSRYDRFIERLDNRDKFYLSTGFIELDRIIGGIDIKEENMVIAARTGQGKTWTLLKIAAEAAKQGLIVGLYSGEMSADKVGYRIDTLLGHLDNKALTRGITNDGSVAVRYQMYLDGLKKNYTGTIKVLTPNDIQGPATVSALRTFIEKENLDILLVDQYSLLEDQYHAKTTHEKVANISKDIKNLQVMSKIPIVSVSQMNRTKNDDGEQDTTQIGLSDRIGQDATTILMLSREITYADMEKTKPVDDKLILNIVKSRDGGAGKLIYKADFNYGNFIFLDPNMSVEASEDLKNYYEEEKSESEVPW